MSLAPRLTLALASLSPTLRIHVEEGDGTYLCWHLELWGPKGMLGTQTWEMDRPPGQDDRLVAYALARMPMLTDIDVFELSGETQALSSGLLLDLTLTTTTDFKNALLDPDQVARAMRRGEVYNCLGVDAPELYAVLDCARGDLSAPTFRQVIQNASGEQLVLLMKHWLDEDPWVEEGDLNGFSLAIACWKQSQARLQGALRAEALSLLDCIPDESRDDATTAALALDA